MPIKRTQSDYKLLPIVSVFDSRLSLAAKGLVNILTLRAGIGSDLETMLTDTNDTSDNILKAVIELANFGYLTVEDDQIILHDSVPAH